MCSKVVSFGQDTTPPVITVQAKSQSVTCDVGGNIIDFLTAWHNNRGGAMATDNSGSFSWTAIPNLAQAISVLNNSDDTLCGNTKNVRVRFIAVDLAGNMSAPTFASFSVYDSLSPVITLQPNNVNLECSSFSQDSLINWIKKKGGARASDVCDGDSIKWTRFIFQPGNGGQGGSGSIANGPYPVIPPNVCNWSINITFLVEDGCGNQSSTNFRTFAIKDTRPPVFSSLPMETTISCEAAGNPPQLTAQDECSGSQQVTYTQLSSQNSDQNSCEHYNYVIQRKWITKDACGNQSEHIQIVTVVDNKKPELTGISPKITNCINAFIPDSLLTVKKDNCSKVNLIYSDSIIGGTACNNIFKRKYTAIDVCNNWTEFIQEINVVDKEKPSIQTKASNNGILCTDNKDINEEFSKWILRMGDSKVVDNCNLVKSFVAVPGSYNINDTTTYPGLHPGLLDAPQCPGKVEGFSRSEQVDFVYYDLCGNAISTSAHFGLYDNTAPEFESCIPSITKSITGNNCFANVNLFLPEYSDNCSEYENPIVRKTGSVIKSDSPGNNEITVNPVILKFGPYNPNSFLIREPGVLNLEFLNLDGDDFTEYFKIFDEDNNEIGKTNNVSGQCGKGSTELNNIEITKLNKWLSDREIIFKLIPNDEQEKVLTINDICGNSRVNAELRLGIETNGIFVNKFYIDGSSDTINVSVSDTIKKELEIGKYNATFEVSDCAGNKSKCITQITIEDSEKPKISCPADVIGTLNTGICSDTVALAIESISATDNCEFESSFVQTEPASSESKKIVFKYVESLGVHLATNKVIRFSNTPKINFTNGVAKLLVGLTADHNNAGEYFEIRGEDGSIIGRTKIGDQCQKVITEFEITKNNYNAWATDGIIELTAVANNEAAEEGKGINPCIALSPGQSLDQISTIEFTLKISSPKIQYSIDNNNKLADLPNDVNGLKIELDGGKHVVNFMVTDNFGNTNSCTTSITINDTEKPKAICKNSIARIHPSGLIDFILVPDSIDNRSNDNCEIDSIWASGNKFTCSEVGMEKEVDLFVRDKNKNVSSCKSRIRIENMKLTPGFTAGLCTGDTLKLFANLPLPQQSNVYSIEWYKDNTLVSIAENPIFPNSDNSFNGLYNLKVKGFNNCTSEGVLNINIKPLSTPTIETSQESYCDNTDITLTTNSFSGIVTYDWYEGFPPNGVLKSSTNSPELEIRPSIGVHNYYVIAKNISCTSNPSLTERVIIYKKPEVAVNNVFQNKCEKGEIILGTSTIGNQFKYKWSGPDGYMSELANPPSIKDIDINKQGKYQLVISIGDCVSDTATSTVIVIPKPERPGISGEPIYCEGKTFTLQVNNIPLQEKYTWYKNGIRFRVTNDNSLEITNASTSLDGAWAVVVESNGCSSDTSQLKNIEIDDLSNIGADNNGPLCEGDSVILTSTTVPNASYKWQGPKDFLSLSQNTKTIASEGEYFITITSSSGCENTTSTFVKVNKIPIITALSNNSLPCMDGNTSIEFFPTVIPEGNYKFEWVGKNFISTLKNAKIENADTSKNGIYTLTVFNEGCPSKKVTSLVNINLIPKQANFDIPVSICEGEDLILTTNVNADSFVWNTPLGIFKTSENKLKLKEIGINGEGSYHLIVNSAGCLSQDFIVKSTTIKNRPLPAGIIGDNEICYNDEIKLSTNNINIENAIWIKPNGNLVEIKEYSKLNADKSDEGIYKVVVVQNGCRSKESNSFLLKVRDEIKTPELNNNNFFICGNDVNDVEICLENFDPAKDYTYMFELKNKNQIIAQSKSKCVRLSSLLFENGEDRIQVKATSDGCMSTIASALINKSIAPNIKAEANIDQTTVCGSDDVLEIKLKSGINAEASWLGLTPGLEILSPIGNSTLIKNFKEGLNVVLMTISKDGCRNFSSDTVFIYFNETPRAENDFAVITYNGEAIIDLLSNDEFKEPYSLELIENSSNGTATLEGNKLKFKSNIGFAGDENLKYKICVSGCDNLCSEANVELRVGSDVECVPPTIFTPNEDGINDVYTISCIGTGKYDKNELRIFNQWGDEVYYSNPYKNDWKGTYGGDPLPAGTYFYSFNDGENANKLNGYLIIQR